MDHVTDAIIEVKAPDLQKAFEVAGMAVVDTTLDSSTVEEKLQKKITASGKDLHYLLYSWLEEVIFLLITDGFAIKRFKIDLEKNSGYKINATAFGEKIDLKKHGFKVEIKAPTFHEMKIEQDGIITMQFLLDL